MRFVHTSKQICAKVTAFADKTGWEHLLVVQKATYSIPENGGEAQLLTPQPLALKDDFDGEPGVSALLYENDFASYKAQCDVMFKAHAYASDGRPTQRVDVIAQVGSMTKTIRVVGRRTWEKDILLIRHSDPEPFVRVPLHYGYAFGGCPSYEEDGHVFQDTCVYNPVGTGYSKRQAYATLYGMPLPHLEVPGRPLKRPDESYPALALSPIPRNSYPRYTFAGTYDQHWREEIAPFLPEDFDERFFQCAPEDQQIPYPKGGEEVFLFNMMPGRSEVRFRLPALTGHLVRVLGHDLSVTELKAIPDTLFFEPDEQRFSVVWRTRMRLGHKSLHDLRMVVSGDLCQAWWTSVKAGKTGCAGCEAFSPDQIPSGCPHQETFPAQRQAQKDD